MHPTAMVCNLDPHHVFILDGAQGTELERRGVDLSGSKLWSAQLVLDNPQLVAEIHRAYLDAGKPLELNGPGVAVVMFGALTSSNVTR